MLRNLILNSFHMVLPAENEIISPALCLLHTGQRKNTGTYSWICVILCLCTYGDLGLSIFPRFEHGKQIRTDHNRSRFNEILINVIYSNLLVNTYDIYVFKSQYPTAKRLIETF